MKEYIISKSIEIAKDSLNEKLSSISDEINSQDEKIEILFKGDYVSILIPDSFPDNLRNRILELIRA